MARGCCLSPTILVPPAHSFYRRFRACRGHSDFSASSDMILRLAAQVELGLLFFQAFFFIGIHDV